MTEDRTHFGPGVGVVIGALLAVAAVTDLVTQAAGWSERTLPSDGPARDASYFRLVYGLTALDVSTLARALGERDFESTVAARPAPQVLDGPLLTVAEEPLEWLPRDFRGSAQIEALQADWKRLTFPNTNPPAGPSLRQARVYIEREAGEGDQPERSRRACVHTELERFQCDVPGWAYTGTTEAKINGSDQRCIWSHPLEGRTTVVDYGRVAPLDEGSLTLRSALDDRAVGDGGPVDVTVRWGDVRTRHVHPDRKGWRTTRVKPPKDEKAARLVLSIHAENVGRRHFCYRLVRR